MKLSVIIPVYNEKETILSLIEQVKAVQLPQKLQKEIVVINDGSNDGTAEILDQIQMTNQAEIKIIHQKENRGKTLAVKIGLQIASGDILIIQDADLEYSPECYPDLLMPILNNEASIVYGSRFKGHIKNMAFINRMANNISNFTVNLLYKAQLTDICTCYKVFKKEVLKDIIIESKNFSFCAEITAKVLKKGHTIVEIPIEYVARKRKEGKKINWSTALEMYFVLIKLRFFS